MNDAFFVRSFQTRGHLLAQAKNLLFGQWAAGEFGLECEARYILRDQIIHAAIEAEIKGHRDAGIDDFRKAQGFAAKLASRRLAQQRQLGQRLERNITIELLIPRAEHYAHSAGTDLLDDAIVAKYLAHDGRGHRHLADSRLGNSKGQPWRKGIERCARRRVYALKVASSSAGRESQIGQNKTADLTSSPGRRLWSVSSRRYVCM